MRSSLSSLSDPAEDVDALLIYICATYRLKSSGSDRRLQRLFTMNSCSIISCSESLDLPSTSTDFIKEIASRDKKLGST